MSLLASHLPKDRFESHVVVLTHSGPFEEELLSQGVPVHLIRKRFKADLMAYLRLKNTLAQLKPDIVHTWLFAANSYGRQIAHSLGVPVIVAGERCVDPWKKSWHGWVDRYLMKKTDCIATNSRAIQDFYAGRGLPSDRFQIIPNAVLPSTAEPMDKQSLCQRLGLPYRKYIVGAIGRLWVQKGYPDLVWAAELLRVAIKDVWFLIIGDGPERERLMELRDQYRSDDVVRFAGHRRDSQELLTAFDLLWNGSLYEGQSNTILEAMQAGVPVIATDIPGNRELVLSGQTGYLYPPGDVGQLARLSYNLLIDEERRRRMSAEGRDRVKQYFSLENMVQQYADLYRRLYENRQRRL
jgi:glycosyltransferase involved in cell wall biosynthesis